ncbi:MAG: UDP-glucose 4-epimerase GalE [Desulfobacteraceae bacterium]|nr:UDP-glucose 4-epimerase GalE [Desulfobacteraceae bacterium]
MTNVLVTGGACYIGSHCCKELHGRGFNPITFDNLVYGYKDFVRWGDFYRGDLATPQDLANCFKNNRIEAVIHFAAYAYVGESVTDPLKYYENNVGNTINLLQAALAHDVRYFIFSSSCATYGIPESIPIDETHPQNPINPYGRTKQMIEDILKDCDAAYGLRYNSLRYFNAAGADPEGEVGEKHNPETHLIPLILDVAAGKSQDIKIFGNDYPTADGTCIRDYIHVTDLARAHVLALERLLDGAASDFYNLGQGRGFSVKEVVEQVSKITGQNIPSVYEDRRPGDPPVLVASNTKAINGLDWQPEYTNLDDIIRTAWNWHIKQ